MSSLRFVVVKGLNGWGDRLQCVLQAIRYAKATGRWLVFDWRDSDWAATGGPSLDHDVDISGVRHFRLTEFLALLQVQGDRMSVTPAAWRHCMDRIPSRDFLYADIFAIPGGQDQIDLIATYQRADFDEDIVIYPSIGHRAYRFADFAHLRPSQWLRDRLTRFAKDHGFRRDTYRVVHLRGGSKRWAGGSAGALKSLEARIEQAFPTLRSYLSHVQAEARRQADDDPALPTYILSDSGWLTERWIEHGGSGTPVPQSYAGPMMETGIFQVPETVLARQGLDKIALNHEMLRDFALMLNARSVASDGISLFSQMAEQVRDHADAWHI